MAKPILLIACVALTIAIIVGIDLSFFRHHFWERLIANVGIVLAFASLYLLLWR